MATLTNQSYSRFHPSSPPEETPTGVTLRANPDVDVVTVTPAAAPLPAPPRASPPLARARARATEIPRHDAGVEDDSPFPRPNVIFTF